MRQRSETICQLVGAFCVYVFTLQTGVSESDEHA
eukprot:CAMPEP_0172687388 /NCGR_PEP_ID=MMETSP1074-20121228/21641_1 /TAXON_ID=2916 /ORGANISM="Ceratium fusus, Strain PA161109" /LENGTH=33 /DNA_ID= /DNA_START= /DNA_END= /DNA_ORIENTATION=